MTAPTAASEPPRLARSSMTVAIGTGLSRLTGMVRVIALAAALGSDLFSDAYNLANTTPNIIYELLIGGVLSATMIPLFVQADREGDTDGPSAMFSVGLVCLATVALAAVLAAPLIAHVYVDGGRAHAAQKIDLLVPLLQLLLPEILFYGLTALATGALNARRRYLAAAFTPVLNNVIVIAVCGYLIVAHHGDPDQGGISAIGSDPTARLVLGIGTTAGIISMAVPLVWSMRGAGIRLHWHLDWRNPMLVRLVRLSGWTLGYVAANQVALAVVLRLADRPPAGKVTAYQNAFIYFQLPHGLIAVTLMTTFLPELARAAVDGDVAGYRKRFAQALHVLLALIVPAAVGYVLLGNDLAIVMLRHGDYSTADAALAGRTLVAFAVGLAGYSVYLLTLRAFYALSDTRTPFFLNLVENGLNVVGAFLLIGAGAVGLAAAYSAAYLIAAVAALVVLHRRVGLGDRAGLRDRLEQFLRILGACAAMAVVIAAARAVVPGGALVRLVVVTPIGLAAYGIAAVALGVDGSRLAVSKLNARLRR